MRRWILVVGFMFTLVVSVKAQDRSNHERSQVPPDAGFELVQSPLAATNTFRVNRFTGDVDQLVHDEKDRSVWERVGRPADPAGPSRDGRPSYYLFTSGLAARWTFLMNIRTGATWQLLRDVDTKQLTWNRVTEPGARADR